MNETDATTPPRDARTSTNRQCPTIPGKTESLITHQIEPGRCMQRQREHYHKCFGCAYRGKPANHVIEPAVLGAAPTAGATNGAAKNGRLNGTH